MMTTSNVNKNTFILLRPYQLKDLQQQQEKEREKMMDSQAEEDKNNSTQQQQQQDNQVATESIPHFTSLTIGGHYHSRHFSGVLRRSEFSTIKTLVIGARSFEKADKFSIISMNQLERVVIYEQSFTERFFVNIRGYFVIDGCPKLEEVLLGDNTFRGFSRIVFRNLASLRNIRLGNGVFYSMEECEFSSRNVFNEILVVMNDL